MDSGVLHGAGMTSVRIPGGISGQGRGSRARRAGIFVETAWLWIHLGARLRDRTATQRCKKGSEEVLGRVLGKGSKKGSEKGACYGFYSRKGF